MRIFSILLRIKIYVLSPDTFGQWAIINEVLEHSCVVKVWDGTIQIRTENLKELTLPLDQRESVMKICERCHRLIQVEGINNTVKAVLATLSKKTWLDNVEERILGCIEGIYFDEARGH